jgi:translation initiation factor IF-2
MSIRIHELAKKHNMEGREMLALLKERGYVSADTKSVSSTVSKIYVEEIEKELAAKVPAPVQAAPAPETPAPAPAPEAPKARMPTGIFVKTAQDVARERETVAKAATVAAAPSRPPMPVAKAPAPPPPRPAPPIPTRVLPPAPMASAAPAAKPAPAVAVIRSAPVPAPALTHAEAPKPAAAPPPLPPRGTSFPRPLPQLSPSMSSAPVVTVQGDVKIIHLKPPVIVRDFAVALSLKPFKLISELNQIVGFASMNSTIEEAVAQKVAEKYGFVLDIKHRGDATAQQQAKDKEKVKPLEDETKDLAPRPPVVVILGHVDHGKTTLLDAIRKANVAAGEAGGITQHIGAYQVEHNGRKITFLDTPGHAAFNKMRARGAQVTDIAVLVVAADDGFMPQTDEALEHARNAKVVVIAAVNKMDVKGANLDQVKGQMQQRGITPEDWGGETITVPISAVKGTGINDLLDMILLQADVLELKANPKGEVAGVVIESQVDVGRGPLSTVIVQKGTLRTGDSIVCGSFWAKVRALFDDQGRPIKEAPPSMPVRVIGWSGTPVSGSSFKGAKNAREAENLAEEEAHRVKKEVTSVASAPKDVSVEHLFANIAATQQKVLKVIIKADVFGSAEAVRQILEGIKSAKVQLEIVSTDVGLVTKNDVIMAAAAGAVILGFSTKLENGVTPLAKHHSVRIETFDIIYELGDKVREMMADLLDPDIKEIKLGAAEVRAIFPLAKGFVAGCLVTEGKVTRGATARLRRGREVVHEGKVATLKRFKDDANEVRAGLECGVKLDDFNGYQAGDVIECYDTQKVRASL